MSNVHPFPTQPAEPDDRNPITEETEEQYQELVEATRRLEEEETG